MPLLSLDDVEDTFTVSGEWITDPSGTIRQRDGAIKVSESKGIEVDGQVVTLTPSEIELEAGSIGSGASGVVQKGTIIRTGHRVAVKGIRVDSNEKKQQLLTEIRTLLQAASSPHLVTFFGCFVSKTVVHVVLELCDLGSLRNLLQRVGDGGQVPLQPCAHITTSSVSGLCFLHSMLIVHRDIKPENILYCSNGDVKVTDFGISRSLDATIAMAGTQIGTQVYMAPEMCLGEDYSFKVDCWSYGLVLYELSTGVFPFADKKNFPELYQALVEDPEPRLHPDFQFELQEFVACCVTRDVTARWGSDNLLQHSLIALRQPQEEFARYVTGG
jgi:serine/threonine protein kinase